ncbi:RNA-guided endonuclease TnpB family protein [Streptomyces sp. SID12488]|uniref:RNA-guided endonuclease InsQ/TnpB family protein n=1 Tax=Streptomyces sp. SID12488 TaxID=2706040 RepID=UPI0013D8E76D|nr:RNA-guided endonuclease TnpB family protein [Streptomyces sp. SID12488]NEA62167.1 IS200/IS605 family element transposase accessory protein TnpB [Streptomyces sp. SID12488]
MKLVVRVKLLPTPVQAAALEATLTACNEAANWVSAEAFAKKPTSKRALRDRTYSAVKERWGLGAQAAQHSIKKTADAYTSLRANLKAGNYGRPGTKRYEKAAGEPITFRAESAQPFDDRMLSWQHQERTVSIWTTGGRMKEVAFTGQAEQLAMVARCRQGESDLIRTGGQWYLLATCEIAEAEPNTHPVAFLGVDLGIVNIATTTDGARHSGRRMNRRRDNDRKLRTKLQKKNTKSAKRRAKKHAGKEARRARDINHKISKSIVTVAQRTGRGIALEELTGIRERVRLRKPQRATLHSWSFHQLGTFIAYKAKRSGIPLVHVNPAYTSQECSQCHHTHRHNRPSQAVFTCRVCGFVEHADLNSSHNIAARGWMTWVRGAKSQAPALTLIA